MDDTYIRDACCKVINDAYWTFGRIVDVDENTFKNGITFNYLFRNTMISLRGCANPKTVSLVLKQLIDEKIANMTENPKEHDARSKRNH